jgi:hypothetical protein
MKKFIYHILVLTAICAVCSRCKHEPQIDPNSAYCGEATTIDEMMEWVYFKEGSYWVYQEQNTGALDTMTVYYDYNGVSSTGNRSFTVKMRSSLDGYTYEYWFNEAWSGDCSLFPGCFCRVVDIDKYIPGDFAGGNHTFVFPLRIGNRAGQLGPNLETGASEIIQYNDTMSINSSLYFDTFTFRIDFSVQHEHHLAIYKIAQNIGIIQKEIPDYNENWLLLNYQISK